MKKLHSRLQLRSRSRPWLMRKTITAVEDGVQDLASAAVAVRASQPRDPAQEAVDQAQTLARRANRSRLL
jgi:hypothetical protein